MTEEKIALQRLLEKGADTDLLRETVGLVAQRLTELDLSAL